MGKNLDTKILTASIYVARETKDTVDLMDPLVLKDNP